MADPADPLAQLKEIITRADQPYEGVDELPARRLGELPGANDVLPDVNVHDPVVLRDRRGGPLRADVYSPHGTGPFPQLVYLHGGAWYEGSAAAVRRLARRLCEFGFVVAAVDYGLAPELPFPTAVEDAVYASRWLTEAGPRFGGDGDGVALAGDSAGANIAAAAASWLTTPALRSATPLDEGDRNDQPVSIWANALFYGVFDLLDLLAIGSRDKQRLGFHETVVNAYLGYKYLEHITDPLVSPGGADLSRWPATYVSCGSADTLLDQSLAFVGALARAGVPVTGSVVEGAPHGFAQFDTYLPAAAAELDRVGTWLRARAAAREAETSG